MTRNREGNSNIYHKIRHFKTDTSENSSITISKKTADKFEDVPFREFIFDKGIALVKSGSEIEFLKGVNFGK